jgi:Protein of unknown function (DUF4058)
MAQGAKRFRFRASAMAVHDWNQVPAGIFHDFHHEWISIIRRALNDGLLPPEYSALAEQQAAGFGPDVLTLNAGPVAAEEASPATPDSTTTGVLAQPRTRFTFESDAEFYRRKKSSVVVRHVSGDRIVAMVEIVSPGNKANRQALRAFVDKACELLEHRIHLLIIDLFPPTRRDPSGIHASIWEEISDEAFACPSAQPLTLASYECGLTTKARVEPVAVGDKLPDMLLYLEPGIWVPITLEATYLTAWQAVPRRWKAALETPRT